MSYVTKLKQHNFMLLQFENILNENKILKFLSEFIMILALINYLELWESLSGTKDFLSILNYGKMEMANLN